MRNLIVNSFVLFFLATQVSAQNASKTCVKFDNDKTYFMDWQEVFNKATQPLNSVKIQDGLSLDRYANDIYVLRAGSKTYPFQYPGINRMEDVRAVRSDDENIDLYIPVKVEVTDPSLRSAVEIDQVKFAKGGVSAKRILSPKDKTRLTTTGKMLDNSFGEQQWGGFLNFRVIALPDGNRLVALDINSPIDQPEAILFILSRDGKLHRSAILENLTADIEPVALSDGEQSFIFITGNQVAIREGLDRRQAIGMVKLDSNLKELTRTNLSKGIYDSGIIKPVSDRVVSSSFDAKLQKAHFILEGPGWNPIQVYDVDLTKLTATFIEKNDR